MPEEKKTTISNIAEASQFFLTAVAIFVYISQGTVFHPENTGYWVLVISLFLFMHTAFLIYVRKSIYTSNFLWIFCFALFTTYILLRFKSGAYSELPDYFTIQILCTFLLIFGLSQCVANKKIISFFAGLLTFFLFFQVVYGLYQRYFALPHLMEEVQKPEFANLVNDPLFLQRVNAKLPFGSVTYPNAWAVLLGGLFLALFFLCIEWYKKKNFKSVFICIVLMCFLGWGLVLSDAKGVWIGCAGLMFLAFFLQIPRIQKLRFGSYLGLGAVGLLFGVIIFYYFIWPMLSFQVRWNYWQAGWNMYIEKAEYLFGLGSSAFGMLYSQFKLPEGWEVKKPHNYFLFLLIEQGVLGLFLFVMIFVVAFFSIFRSKPQEVSALPEQKEENVFYENIFIVSFFLYCILLPMFYKDVFASNILNLLLAFYLMIIGLVRFLRTKKILKALPFESNLVLQFCFFISILISFALSWLPTLLKQDSWVYIEKGRNSFRPQEESVIYLLSFLLFVFFLKLLKGGFLSSLLQKRIYALLFFAYVIMQLAGDMVGHFQAVPIVIMAFFVLYNAHKGENALALPKLLNGAIYFTLLSFSIFIYLFVFKPAHSFYGDYKKFDMIKNSKTPKLNQILPLSELVKKHPKNTIMQFSYGDLLSEVAEQYEREEKNMMRMEYLQKAVNHWDQVAKNFPELAKPHYEMALLFQKADEKDPTCIDLYLRAIKRYPLKGLYHLGLANAYLKNGDPENALVSFEEVIRIQKLSDKNSRVHKEEYEKVLKTVLDLKRNYE